MRYSKEMYNVTKDLQILCVFFYSLYVKNCITVSTKKQSSTNVFNIDNNKKCFLSSKLGSCDTEHWSNNAENSSLPRHK